MAAGIDGIIRGGDNDDTTQSYSDGENGLVEPPPSTGATFRRGGRCCGCCCDYRRAVLIIDTMLLIFCFITFIYEVAVEENMIKFTGPQTQDEEDFNKMQEQFKDSAMLKFGIVANALFVIVFLPCSLCGALKYKWAWVVPFCAWYIISQILTLILSQKFCKDIENDTSDGNTADNPSCQPNVFSYLLQTVVILLVLYPHVVFVRQCRRGILSQDTYAQEKSCCCSA